MGVLRIDTDRYVEAAGLAASAGHRVTDAVAGASTALMRTAGMAGWDAMGAEWAAAYDPAAREVLAAGQELALAASDSSRALTLAAGNYIAAEHVASMGLSALIVPLMPSAVLEAGAPFIPSASEPNPRWPPLHWDIIAGIAGVMWPAGDPELLQSAGTSWSRFADEIEVGIAGPAAHARDTLEGLLAEDLTLFLERSAAVHESGQLIAQASRDVAAGCAALAEAVAQAHQELFDETQSFAVECVALMAVGTALSFVTLGGSAAITALVGAARTAQMVARVHQVVTRLTVIGRTVSVVAMRLPGAGRLTAGLQTLARTPVTLQAAATSVRRGFAAASAAASTSGGLVRLAPAVRIVRPIGVAGLRVLDSTAVSVALSSPAALLREQASNQVRRSLFVKAVPGSATDQIIASVRGTRLGTSSVIPAVESAVTTKDRVDTAVGLVGLPGALRDRHAPGRIETLAPRAWGPGRLTAVQVSPATGSTASSTRAPRTSRQAASP